MPADRLSVLRMVLIAGALLMIGAGVVIYLTTDEVLGAILAGFGILDLLTVPLVVRLIARNAALAEAEPAGEDPDYNPYSRED